MTLLSIILCVLTMLNSWLVSRGRLRAVYLIGILLGIGYLVINAMLAASGASVAFLIIPSAWGILTSALGLRRLNNLTGNNVVSRLSTQKEQP